MITHVKNISDQDIYMIYLFRELIDFSRRKFDYQARINPIVFSVNGKPI